MNGDALSDLVLSLVCLLLFALHRRGRPGLAFSCAALGITAAFGVAKLVGVAQAAGPHRFLVLLTSCVGLPLLADSVTFPDGEPARTRRGAALFLFMGTMLAVLLVVVLNLKFLLQLLPALSVLVLLIATLRDRRPLPILGAALFAATFAVLLAKVSLHGLSDAQVLHYGMAAAMLLIVGIRPRRT